MTLTKILCATDFSAGADRALRMATRLACETGAELVIAHSWFIPANAYSLEVPFVRDMEQEIRVAAQHDLDAAVRDATTAGARRASGKLLSGVPWMEIVSLLEHQPFELCVIGTHGRTGLSRILLGSVAEKVVRHSPCSTLVVRPDAKLEQFAHALVPTDFSASAEHALELATQLVRPKGSITLLHVIELPVRLAGEVPDVDFARTIDKRAALALDEAAARVGGDLRVNVCTRIGSAGAQTLDATDDDSTIDLVVMGSHGRTGIKRALLGSVAEKVVRHAGCPVLVARKRA